MVLQLPDYFKFWRNLRAKFNLFGRPPLYPPRSQTPTQTQTSPPSPCSLPRPPVSPLASTGPIVYVALDRKKSSSPTFVCRLRQLPTEVFDVRVVPTRLHRRNFHYRSMNSNVLFFDHIQYSVLLSSFRHLDLIYQQVNCHTSLTAILRLPVSIYFLCMHMSFLLLTLLLRLAPTMLCAPRPGMEWDYHQWSANQLSGGPLDWALAVVNQHILSAWEPCPHD